MNKEASSPTVSVAMATYNGDKYIREQLESLAAQTVLPLELVITDDGSTDKTVEIAEAFAAIAPFSVKIFRNEHKLGFAGNFLRAAEICKGDWIAFCDQDDVWGRRKIEMICGCSRNPEVVLVSHNYTVINAEGETVRPVKYSSASRCYFEKKYWSVFLGFTVSFRRSCLEKYLIILRNRKDRLYPDMPHDNIVCVIGMLAGKVFVSDQHLVCYRRHGKNVSGNDVGVVIPSRSARLWGAYGELRDRFFLIRQINQALPAGEQLNTDFILKTARFLRRRLMLRQPDVTIGTRLNLLLRNLAAGVYASKMRVGLGKRALVIDALSTFGWRGM